MKKILFIIIGCLSIIYTSSVYACDLDSNDALFKCLNNAKTTVEMNVCFGNEYNKCDKLLNEEYQKTIKRADDEEKQKLKEMEKLWLKFIELHCSIDVDFSGSGSRLSYSNCKIWEIKNRIKQLQKYFVYEDGVVIK